MEHYCRNPFSLKKTKLALFNKLANAFDLERIYDIVLRIHLWNQIPELEPLKVRITDRFLTYERSVR